MGLFNYSLADWLVVISENQNYMADNLLSCAAPGLVVDGGGCNLIFIMPLGLRKCVSRKAGSKGGEFSFIDGGVMETEVVTSHNVNNNCSLRRTPFGGR